MSKNLEFFRLRGWLTFDEICCLTCGRDPYISYVTDHDELCVLLEHGEPAEFAKDDGYDSFQTLLRNAIYDDFEKENRLYAADKKAHEIELRNKEETGYSLRSLQKELKTLIFRRNKMEENIFLEACYIPETVRDLNNDKDLLIKGSSMIEVNSLKKWFEKLDYKPEFFFPESGSKGVMPYAEGSLYQTKLMQIMQQAISRYYGDNFDVDDKDTYPLQNIVVEWLKNTFSLSQRQAEAIEIIISPRGGNYPQGKI